MKKILFLPLGLSLLLGSAMAEVRTIPAEHLADGVRVEFSIESTDGYPAACTYQGFVWEKANGISRKTMTLEGNNHRPTDASTSVNDLQYSFFSTQVLPSVSFDLASADVLDRVIQIEYVCSRLVKETLRDGAFVTITLTNPRTGAQLEQQRRRIEISSETNTGFGTYRVRAGRFGE